MRFSILLPTRNGGNYLADCIASILEQDHPDFELVISDNANTDATADVVRRFVGDPRVTVVRQDTPISVARNWTAALHASHGEYVLMMGDDDYLLPGALCAIDRILSRHGDPECVLYNGYSYVTPEAISGNAQSFWSTHHFQYGPDLNGEAELSESMRAGVVRDMFRFRPRIPLNMQTTLFARRAIARECGDEFKAPFPDHFLLNALLIAANRWVFTPERFVIVGISPKSFGHYFYSQDARAGLAYLAIDTDFDGALPGSELLNGMYTWLSELKQAYPRELAGVEIDRAGYVRRQAYAWLVQRRYRGLSTRELVRRFTLLGPRDWAGLLMTVVDGESWRRVESVIRMSRRSRVQSLSRGIRPLPGVRTIREFAAWLQRGAMASE